MNTRFYFEKIKQDDKKNLERYFQEKKISRLSKLLQHGNLEVANFILNAKYHQHHNIFLVRLRLTFTDKNLRSEDKSQNLLEAFDLAFDHLINQLRKIEDIRHNK
ncbi:MAG: HPF/RaiA family ribosome-associated protein [Candidatus Nealsonbacteria bacterium]